MNAFNRNMTEQSSLGEATGKSETTRLENSTYNILRALGKEANFLQSGIDTYINDPQEANKNDLVDMRIL